MIFFSLNIFLAFIWLVFVEQLKKNDRNRVRERGTYMQQRAPVQDSNPGPLQRGQSLCIWDAALPTDLNATPSISFLQTPARL